MKLLKNIVFLTIAFASIASGPAFARDKTDVIWMINGDRITGEIKKLERGKLSVKTDSIGLVAIDWKDIDHIKSDYSFQFERSDGKRITGTINPGSGQQLLSLSSAERTVDYQYENVVRISQIEDGFWERLKGSLSLGYSFTKASNVAQANFGLSATHRTEIRSFKLDSSMITTNDQDGNGTRRADHSFNMTRYRSNRWFNSVLVGFESNDELGLKLRSSLGASMGRFLVQTNTSELGAIVGLAGTSEVLEGEASSQRNLEGVLSIDYSRYVFDDPAMDLSTTLTVYPGITEAGRTRSQFDINLRWEMIKDLYWNLNYYNSYDSDPPPGSTSNNDYGIVTSLGWSF